MANQITASGYAMSRTQDHFYIFPSCVASLGHSDLQTSVNKVTSCHRVGSFFMNSKSQLIPNLVIFLVCLFVCLLECLELQFDA